MQITFSAKKLGTDNDIRLERDSTI